MACTGRSPREDCDSVATWISGMSPRETLVDPEPRRTPEAGPPGPLSIVTLAHNAAKVIEPVVRGFHREIVSRLAGSEFIVAEDGSRDGTPAILDRKRTRLNSSHGYNSY